MFRTSDLMNSFGRQMIQSDTPDFTIEQLRDLEDEILGALLLVRQTRQFITATPIMEKGQRA